MIILCSVSCHGTQELFDCVRVDDRSRVYIYDNRTLLLCCWNMPHFSILYSIYPRPSQMLFINRLP